MTELYTDNLQTFNNWKKKLNERCILLTFHEDFVVKKCIGKGSFAKVYLAHKKDNPDKLYAVKAFN